MHKKELWVTTINFEEKIVLFILVGHSPILDEGFQGELISISLLFILN